jgi:hypothetical protein
VERALLESAQRPRVVGGIATVAEALARAERVNEATINGLAGQLDYTVGLRRLVALERGLGLHTLEGFRIPPVEVREIPLDPTDRRTEGQLDETAGVRWPGPVEELRAVIDY